MYRRHRYKNYVSPEHKSGCNHDLRQEHEPSADGKETLF
jgi:hypothetical protein